MASIDDLKDLIDLHDLAEKLGLQRPQGRGNYRSPHHPDKNPSLSVFAGARRWKDHSSGDGGSCIDLVMYVEGCDEREAMRRLHELYGIPLERPAGAEAAPRKKSRAEFIAERCLDAPEPVIEYLSGRGILEEVARRALERKTVGWNAWTSEKVAAGEVGHGGPAAAFIVRSMNPGHVVAVDMRYVDPGLNGGVKTQTQGEKYGHPWVADLGRLQKARRVYVVESPVNALSVECCEMPYAAAVAVRGTGNVENIDWSFLQGKQAVLAFDWDSPDHHGRCAGQEAAWRTYELLTARNIAAHLVDQGDWEHNDVNDLLQAAGADELRMALQRLEPWAIPGMAGDSDRMKGRGRVFLPGHDYAQYWRFRCKEDFTSYVTERKVDEETEQETLKLEDLAGFRVAAISRVTVASATSAMTGEKDAAPHTLFAVSVQAPRHGHVLQRRVFEDEQLHNVDHWRKFGPVFRPAQFLRLVNILERSADLGARHAVNFVGLAWREGRSIVNHGPDCYFTSPEKQCPYHNLVFPSGSARDARTVLQAYQETFAANAAALVVVWALGGHLKAFLGFWPHLVMQADKGAGKSTLVKRLERTLAMTMFSRQTINTDFRLMTSVSHTSHPVGWEEISAGRQEIIDKAVSTLQECYQYTVTRRGAEMTEYLLAAPVLLAGEDVPVRSLTGKVIRTELSGRKGPMLREDLPRFPVQQWLEFLAGLSRRQVLEAYDRSREYAQARCRATGRDDGARRMVDNYAVVLTAWRLLCEFADMDTGQGGFVDDVVQEMNTHITETSTDREPWVWIMEILLSELEAHHYRHPYKFDDYNGHPALYVRDPHIMDHIRGSLALRDVWNSLPVKTARVLKRQLRQAGVLLAEDGDRVIGGKRVSHMLVLSLEKLEEYGLFAAVDEPTEWG